MIVTMQKIIKFQMKKSLVFLTIIITFVSCSIFVEDEFGNVIALFNSAPLNTGDKFEYTFEEAGVYNYFCSFHPWRVGVVTVS